MKVSAHLVMAAVLLLGGAASAQTVWRCGPDGRSYSQQPCTDGRAVAAADHRTAEDLAQARQVAQREQALADQLRQARQQREAQWPAGVGLASLGPSASKPGHAHAKRAHRTGKAGKADQANKSGPSNTVQKAKTRDGQTPPQHFTALSVQPG